jgi:hypothetical protein
MLWFLIGWFMLKSGIILIIIIRSNMNIEPLNFFLIALAMISISVSYLMATWAVKDHAYIVGVVGLFFLGMILYTYTICNMANDYIKVIENLELLRSEIRILRRPLDKEMEKYESRRIQQTDRSSGASQDSP